MSTPGGDTADAATATGPTDLEPALALRAAGIGETSIAVREAAIDEVLALVAAFEPDPAKDGEPGGERSLALIAELNSWCEERRQVLMFLRSNPNPFQTTFTLSKLAEWCRFRLDYPFLPLDEARGIIDLAGSLKVLPEATVAGEKVMYCENFDQLFALMKDKEVGFKKVIRAIWPVFLHDVISEDVVQIAGIVQIVDMSSFSVSAANFLKSDPEYKLYKKRESDMMATGAIPMRMKDVYLLDAPWYFRWIWAVISMFMRKEIVRLIHFKQVPKDIPFVRGLFRQGARGLPALLMQGAEPLPPQEPYEVTQQTGKQDGAGPQVAGTQGSET